MAELIVGAILGLLLGMVVFGIIDIERQIRKMK
jgi:hypothetical protein